MLVSISCARGLEGRKDSWETRGRDGEEGPEEQPQGGRKRDWTSDRERKLCTRNLPDAHQGAHATVALGHQGMSIVYIRLVSTMHS